MQQRKYNKNDFIEAFDRMLDNVPYNEIDVKSLCFEVVNELSRKVFYKNFKNKQDLLKYIVETEYKNANTKIIVKCSHRHLWETTWGKFQSNRRCPYCSGKFNSYDTIKELIESEDGYKLLSTDCSQLRDRVKIKCKHGHIYKVIVGNFKRGTRCPYCNESKGEEELKRILSKYSIDFKPQYKFKDCKFYKRLSFDFYLPQYNICIEYDGEFHYKMIMGYDEFVNSKIRDTIKTKYCKDNNIKLIRIPYWDFNEIENIICKEILNK